jgi:hypothetical protein
MDKANKNELMSFGDGFENVADFNDEANIPEVVVDVLTTLNKSGKKVEEVLKAADNAMDKAYDAKELSAGFFKRKATIEALQEAVVYVAESGAVSAEMLQVTFEFQKKLADATKYLFGLSAGSIAANQSVVRQLQLYLDGASKGKLSELMKNEIMGVIHQLKRQEDLMIKVQNLQKNVMEQGEAHRAMVVRQDAFETREEQQDDDIEGLQDDVASQEEKIKHNKEKIGQNRAKIEENKEKIAQNKAKIQEQELESQLHAELLKRMEAEIASQDEEDKRQAKFIAENRTKIEENEEQIRQNRDIIAQNKAKIEIYEEEAVKRTARIECLEAETESIKTELSDWQAKGETQQISIIKTQKGMVMAYIFAGIGMAVGIVSLFMNLF